MSHCNSIRLALSFALPSQKGQRQKIGGERERGKNKEMMKSPLQEEGERERATHVVRLGSVSEKKNLFKRGENYSHRVYF